MSELDDTMKGVQRREVLIRAVDTEKREIEGIAVPWGQTADIGWFTESVERGAVVESDDAQLWWRHKDPIGAMSYHEDQDGGWFVRMKVSKTSLGEDALTLARDGVVTNFSIGFEPIEYTIREDGDKTHITQTKIRVREISLVPFLPMRVRRFQMSERATLRRERPCLFRKSPHHRCRTSPNSARGRRGRAPDGNIPERPGEAVARHALRR